MLKKLKSKLKSKSGLTLTEMLITVILLMFFSSACLLGISTALSTRRDMIKAADADILCSTVTQYISNELRLSIKGNPIEGNTKFTYDGGSTYANLTCGDSDIWVNYDDEKYPKGCLMRRIGRLEDDENHKYNVNNIYPVFNESAYSGFTLANLQFEIIHRVNDDDNDKIKCSFDIKDGETTVKSTEFTVTPINPVTPPSGT